MFKNILFLTIPSAIMVLLLLELVFRFVIPAANKPDLVFEEREKIIHFDPSTNAKGVFTVGRFALLSG